MLFIFQGIEWTLQANAHHTKFLDFFFSWYTRVAEWPVIVLAIVLAFSKNRVAGFTVSAGFVLEALIVNTTKSILNAPRPRVEAGIDSLHQIAGVDILSWQSFPSGHTAAAFIGFGFLSMIGTNGWIQAFCGAAAILVGYSRMYLGQHYLRDVTAGAVVGLSILLLFNWLYPKILNKFYPVNHEQ